MEIWLNRGGQYFTQNIIFEGNFIETTDYTVTNEPILNVMTSFNWVPNPGDLTSAKRAFYVNSPGLGGNTTIALAADGGNVGIGTTSPSYQLQLSANSAGKPGGGSWSDSSDIRLKKNITPITGALDKILKLQGVNFQWINPSEHGNFSGIQGGFLAQDLQNVFPDWIQQIDPSGLDKNLIPEGQKVLSLNLPFEFNALVVESIKELNTKINDLNLKLNGSGLISASSTAEIVKTDVTANIAQWMQNTLQSLGITLKEGIASLKGIVADIVTSKRFAGDEANIKKVQTEQIQTEYIQTNQICVKDSGNNDICLTGDQLHELLNKTGTSMTITTTYSMPPEDLSPKNDQSSTGKAELEKPVPATADQDSTVNTTSTAAISGNNQSTGDNQSSAISDHSTNEGQTEDSGQSSTGNATSTSEIITP